jgi:glutamate racemase
MSPIGVFDSGYGGITILKEFVRALPQYDYIYLGDSARSPYGTRSFEVVHQFTLECVEKLFDQGCQLVILACNTASAKALRTIQQKNLPVIDPDRRVLGVIRPTAEVVGNYTKTNSVGILGTQGTVASLSYLMEIEKFFPQINVYQEACPLWVPLIENNEHISDGADYFVKKNIEHLLHKGTNIDTIVLGCTHYSLLLEKIKKYTPNHIQIISQGEIIAESLKDYLLRHPEMEVKCSKTGSRIFYTTDTTDIFDQHASVFFGQKVISQRLIL